MPKSHHIVWHIFLKNSIFSHFSILNLYPLRKTSQKLRNCPNSRYSEYSRIVKFNQPPSVWYGRVWIHNNELMFRLANSLGLLFDGVFLMSSKVSLWGCSLNVFVIIIVFVFVVVLLVRSCFPITLIKCLKGKKSQRLLFKGAL